MNELLNTKQVAQHLGINEKKVYALAKGGKLPCTRVTGKWLFPKKLVDEWIERNSRGFTSSNKGAGRGAILGAGSDDPSLGILKELYASRDTSDLLFLATVGSSAGLSAIEHGSADFALAHLLDTESGQYNIPFLEKIASSVVVVSLVRRQLGLLVAPGNPLGLRTLGDLTKPGLKIINRQLGSGTRRYIDLEFSRLGIAGRRVPGYDNAVFTHFDVGLKILRQEADAGVATASAARSLGLDFTPLVEERFDVVIPRERFFAPGVQALLEIVGSNQFRGRVDAMGGYDTSESGRIIASSPK